MAALDFPNSPTTNQQYAAPNGVTYQWDGAAWIAAGGPANVWTDTGTTLTPTDATKSVTVPGSPAGSASLVLPNHDLPLLKMGVSPTFSRLGTYTDGTFELAANYRIDTFVADDGTKPSWLFEFGGTNNDNIKFQRRPANQTGAFTTLLTLDNAGNLTIAGPTGTKSTGTTWANPSDIRLKQDIGTYERGLADILKLSPISYRLKADPERECQGFDAAAVRDVFPECIGTTKMKLTEDGDEEEVLTFDLHPVLVALVNATKELAARVAALEGHTGP